MLSSTFINLRILLISSNRNHCLEHGGFFQTLIGQILGKAASPRPSLEGWSHLVWGRAFPSYVVPSLWCWDWILPAAPACVGSLEGPDGVGATSLRGREKVKFQMKCLVLFHVFLSSSLSRGWLGLEPQSPALLGVFGSSWMLRLQGSWTS